VFLRTAEKKREASRSKEDKDSEPATPVEAPKQTLPASGTPFVETPTGETPGVNAAQGQPDGADNTDDNAPAQPFDQVTTDFQDPDDMPLTKSQATVAHHEVCAVEAPQQDEASDAQNVPPPEGSAEAPSTENSNEQTLTNRDTEANGEGDDDQEKQEGDDKDGDDQEKPESESMDGNVPNGGFSESGDFNQMQMMMAMQNGMAPNSFGGFPMMGKCWQDAISHVT
jgi:hypothetical protein